MKRKDKYDYKSVRKAIGKEKSRINGRKDITKIEKLYLCKKAIKEYYEKHESKISDNDLIKIYNKEYRPGVLRELAIGLFSGLLASDLEDVINFQFPYKEEFRISEFTYSLVLFIIFLFLAVVFFFLLLFIYNQISSMSSYGDKIHDYHREILDEYIIKREEKYEKRNKNEVRNSRKNRKHK